MLLIVDTANIGVAPEPSGGFTFKLDNIEGLNPDISILVPVNGANAHAFIEAAQEAMGISKPKIETYGPKDIPDAV